MSRPPSFANRANLDLIEDTHQRWLADPESVDASWRALVTMKVSR